MKLEMNKKMRNLLEKNNLSLANSYKIEDNLKPYLQSGIEEYKECFLLKSQMEAVKTTFIEDCYDRTGFESFINHIHLGDIVSNSNIVIQALAFTQELSKMLKNFAPKKNFKVIVSGNKNDLSIRFHLVRANESWLSDNLDGYEEAILALDV